MKLWAMCFMNRSQTPIILKLASVCVRMKSLQCLSKSTLSYILRALQWYHSGNIYFWFWLKPLVYTVLILSKFARYTTLILHVFRKLLRNHSNKMQSGEVAWCGYKVSLIKCQFSFGSINLLTAEAIYIRNYEDTPNIYAIIHNSPD